MKKEIAPAFIEKLNANMDVVAKVLRENLGIDGNPFITQRKNRYDTEVYVTVEEDEETTRQLTATPLLRQMFKKAGLGIRCWYDEDTDNCVFDVNVYYNHYFSGGSNGVEIMRFSINFTTGEVQVKTER